MPPKVDESKCDGCGSCVDVCPADPVVFEIVDKKSKVKHPDDCLECGSCVDECPKNAIELLE